MAGSRENDARTIGDAVAALRNGGGRVRTYANGRVDYAERRREFCSYGWHFPLAHYVPRNGKHAALWLINGDVWRGSRVSRTRTHQEETRRAIAATGDASIVLPFSAIGGAGIVPDSIRPIHVRADAQWTEYDALADAIDLDALETAHETEPFDNSGAIGIRYSWSGASGAGYSRTLYRRASVFTGARTNGGAAIHEWRESDADPWQSAPVSEHAYLNRGTTLERRPEGWRAVRNVHRLGDSLFSAVRVDPRTGETLPRSRFLSSFDYGEAAPLYFLCQVPRGAGETVDTALDALAPRAVHAAHARGRDVKRQGDIFFVGTSATRESLTARGATFARLTQFTREAAPRAGEIGYRAPLPAAQRRARHERELAHARKLWRERFRGAVARAETSSGTLDVRNETERDERRRVNGELWRELTARHAAERAACEARDTWTGAAESVPCETCTAGIGEPCRYLTAGEVGAAGLAERIEYERVQNDGAHRNRVALAHRQKTERDELKRATAAPSRVSRGRPVTRENRSAFKARRSTAERALAKAREDRRRATFEEARAYYLPYPYSQRGGTRAAPIHALRIARVAAIVATRRAEAEARERLAHARQLRGIDRDAYRRLYGSNAASAWTLARHHAALKYRPQDVGGADQWRRERERVRVACAIYGTAHGATELARLPDGRIYARGTVRHVPDLETGRGGTRDHRPVELGDGWYLALRNRVPRQTRRRRRETADA